MNCHVERLRAQAFLTKVKFEVNRSRNLLMVPDESGLLEPDEVFVQRSPLDNITDHWPADRGGVIVGPVVVCRSPAYHGNHVLVLKAVGSEHTSHGRAVLSALGHLQDGTCSDCLLHNDIDSVFMLSKPTQTPT